MFGHIPSNIKNIYDKGTFKYDFIELWNNRFKDKKATLMPPFPILMAEIAEIIMIAGIWGNVSGENNKEQSPV